MGDLIGKIEDISGIEGNELYIIIRKLDELISAFNNLVIHLPNIRTKEFEAFTDNLREYFNDDKEGEDDFESCIDD